jgi:hypothetical protein
MITTDYKLVWTLYEDPLRPYVRHFKTREDAFEFAHGIEGAKTITLYTETREEIKIQ